jgi:hypothetical protein
MSDISQQGTNFIRDLGEAARQNPVSAALIGMGVFWMLSGRGTAGHRASEMARRTRLDQVPDDAAGEALDAAGPASSSGVRSMRTGISSAAEQVQDGATEVFDTASRFGREQAETAYEYVRSVPETGMEMMQNARSNLTEIFRTQPLALGAVGLAIGAGIAAALPPTEVETDYLGETSGAFKERAQALVAEQATRTAAAAESAISAAAEEARNQGLTVEDAKFAASEISAKMGRVISAAEKKASEGAN